MVLKIKDLKAWCETKDDNDVVFLCTYDWDSECYDNHTSGRLYVRPPQKVDFKHKECKHYELIDVKGELREFCNKENEFFHKNHSHSACRYFESEQEINFCKECNRCRMRYCENVKDNNSKYVGNGFLERAW